MSGLSLFNFNYDVGSINTITGKIEYEYYGYNTSKAAGITFVVLFSISLLVHLFQLFKSRRWWMIVLCVGVLTEVIGWSARLISAVSVEWAAAQGGYWSSSGNAFLAQISTLIFAPAFLQAANYIILGWVTLLLGSQFARVHRVTYSVVFVTGDVISLVVQAIGGGMASSANSLAGANQGAYVMVGGVFAQLAVMLVYTALLIEFCVRYTRNRPVRRMRPFSFIVDPYRRRKGISTPVDELEGRPRDAGGVDLTPREIKLVKLQLFAIAGSTFLIFIRSIYRCIELLDGWTGPIIQNQGLFDGLDGAMMIASCFLLNALHPLFLLKPLSNPTLTQRDDVEKRIPAASASPPSSLST